MLDQQTLETTCHDLKQPLTRIKAHLYFLKKLVPANTTSEEWHQHLEKIDQDVDQLAESITKLANGTADSH